MKTSTALVTGGTGFIGSHLIRKLLQQGFRVHMLCRSCSNFWRLEDVLPKVVRHCVALEEADRLQEVITQIRPDYIFHLASATVVAGSAAAAAELVGVNLLGTVNLLTACELIDYQGLVTTGDSFEYTSSPHPLRESDPCYPTSLHGITKLAATLQAQSVARVKQRPIVTLRLFSTYGPDDHPRRLVPITLRSALSDRPLNLSRPEIARDWIYIEDLIELYLEAGHRAKTLAGKVFNAGTGVNTNLAALVEMVLRLTASTAETHWGVFTAPAHDDYPWVADMTHTFEHFNWRPRIFLEAGLQKTIAQIKLTQA